MFLLLLVLSIINQYVGTDYYAIVLVNMFEEIFGTSKKNEIM